MAIAIVQTNDTGTSTMVSGSAQTLFGSAVGAGNTVVLFCAGTSGAVPGVTGLGATWTAIGTAQGNGPGGSRTDQIWVGTGCTGGTQITLTIGSNPYLAAFELSGVSSAADGGASATAGLTMTGLAAGEMICVFFDGQSPASASPSSPWTVYAGTTGGYWASAPFFSVAYQTTSGSSNQTATWTVGANAGTLGVILTAPASPLPLRSRRSAARSVMASRGRF